MFVQSVKMRACHDISVLQLLLLCASFTENSAQMKPEQLSHNRGRIIGGQYAFAAQFPFAAALYITTRVGKFFCVGSLIDPQWILTAGQCVDNATLFTVHLGSVALESEDGNRLTVATSEHVLHPNYNGETLDHDVGLVRFRISITYTTYINKIRLAYGTLDDYFRIIALGWGHTSDSAAGLSNYLRWVSVSTVPNLECTGIYGDQISERMVCIAGEFNEGACTGDSGGPLVHYDSDSVRHVGISSFLSGNGCESADPSGYTRTYAYSQWITNITGIPTRA